MPTGRERGRATDGTDPNSNRRIAECREIGDRASEVLDHARRHADPSFASRLSPR